MAHGNQMPVWALLDVALIIGLCLLVAVGSKYLRQPLVVGELILGICIGPTLLGAPGVGLTDAVFPVEVRPTLGVLAQFGVILFVFFTALEIDMAHVCSSGRATLLIAAGGFLTPFIGGVLVGLAFDPASDRMSWSTISFAIFIGLALSVTAFPVLARVLDERNQRRTALGTRALSVASVVDLAAWVGITAVIAFAGSAASSPMAPVVALGCVWIAGRYALAPLLRRLPVPSESKDLVTPVLVVAALTSAAAAAASGTEAILGGVLLGLSIPRDAISGERARSVERVGQLASLLVPVFFVVLGLELDLRAMTVDDWSFFGICLLVALGAKCAGTYVCSRSAGHSAAESAELSILMNMRGLTEAVVVQAGVAAAVLSRTHGTALILIGLITTAMAAPLLDLTNYVLARCSRPSVRPEVRAPQTVSARR